MENRIIRGAETLKKLHNKVMIESTNHTLGGKMKHIKQLAIILAVAFIGECLNTLLPLPIPASIYGLVLMLLALNFNIIKLESIKETAAFLIEIMPIMFIPATVGLIVVIEELQSMLVPLIVISVASTIVVMVVTGKVTDLMLSFKKGGEQ